MSRKRACHGWDARTLLLLTLLALAACGRVELFSGLTENEANTILGLLLRNGIATEKATQKTGTSISVESGRVSDAIDLVRGAGLPREKFTNMGELFTREGLIASPATERVRYLYGLTQELSKSLTAIVGVLGARVHIVLPDNDPTGRAAKPSSAAVMISYSAGAVVDELVPKVKQFVVNSIEGLSYDRVSVLLVPAEVPPPVTAKVPKWTETLEQPEVFGLALALLSLLLANAAAALWLWHRNGFRLPPRADGAPPVLAAAKATK